MNLDSQWVLEKVGCRLTFSGPAPLSSLRKDAKEVSEESHTVTANSLPRFKALRAHAYIKDAAPLPRNARFQAKWAHDLE